MQKTIHCDKLDEINRVADEILQFAAETRVITFSGSLGAGKTTIIKEICKQLNVDDNVNSPTFAILNEYKTLSNDVIYHFDFYRIKSVEEAMDLGYENYFFSGKYCFIEWPEMINSLIDFEHVSISIEIDEERRVIKMSK